MINRRFKLFDILSVRSFLQMTSRLAFMDTTGFTQVCLVVTQIWNFRKIAIFGLLFRRNSVEDFGDYFYKLLFYPFHLIIVYLYHSVLSALETLHSINVRFKNKQVWKSTIFIDGSQYKFNSESTARGSPSSGSL